MSNNQNNGPEGPKTYKPLSFQERVSVWLPLLMSLMLGVGTWIGLQIRTQARQSYVIVKDGETTKKQAMGVGKVEEILRFVDARYLEGVDLTKLEDAAIKGLLHELDPHSTYIPSSRLQSVKESLQGNFEGIGIEFFMQDDTVLVVGVVPNGPSAKAGVMVGDKLLKINDTLVSGVKNKNTDIVDRLKGVEGSSVQVELLRRGEDKTRAIKIDRGQIPRKSVETSFMLDENTGYIKITRFSGKTYEEFMKALEVMVRDQGMKDLVIDLRHNPGGYLNEATEILNQLFNDKRLLVYTEGRSYKRKEYKSTGKAFFRVNKLIILIDEGSASASEILAGAIQDNDRGLIVGRRSFGKGLVQEQYELSDASALRLTVARYFTPSGRLIQRSYESGLEDYDSDMDRRYKSGELFYRDSIKVKDSTEYKTSGGRVVYGGGAIIPDIFVPADTIVRNRYYQRMNAYLTSFVYKHMDQAFADYKTYNDNLPKFLKNYQVSEDLLLRFQQFAEEKGKISHQENPWLAAKEKFATYIKAYIGQQLFGDEGFHQVLAQKDKDVRKALEELKRGGTKLTEAGK